MAALVWVWVSPLHRRCLAQLELQQLFILVSSLMVAASLASLTSLARLKVLKSLLLLLQDILKVFNRLVLARSIKSLSLLLRLDVILDLLKPLLNPFIGHPGIWMCVALHQAFVLVLAFSHVFAFVIVVLAFSLSIIAL